MSTFDTNSYTTTGAKAVVTVKDDKITIVAINAPSDAVYDLEFQLDSSGDRHKLVENINGNFNARLAFGANSVALDVTAIPSGTIVFEVLSEVTLIL